MAVELVKVDRNGTKYFEDTTCDKCHGKGYIEYYAYHDNGVCYQCSGSGQYTTRWVERTAEYEAKLNRQRLDKLKRQAPEKNASFLEKHGFNKAGEIWLVLGNTYPIKDELKAKGSRFNPMFGWTFNSAVEGYDLHKLSKDDKVSYTDYNGTNCVDTIVHATKLTGIMCFMDEVGLVSHIKNIKKQYELSHAEPTSYVGQIGERLDLTLTLVKIFSYTTVYGATCIGATCIHKFSDIEGNTLFWKTSPKGMEEGSTYSVRGTIKEHSEYNGQKQTVITRCKYMEVNAGELKD